MQKYANLVELEKSCQTHISCKISFRLRQQNFVLVQPRTSSLKFCKIANFADPNLLTPDGAIWILSSSGPERPVGARAVPGHPIGPGNPIARGEDGPRRALAGEVAPHELLVREDALELVLQPRDPPGELPTVRRDDRAPLRWNRAGGRRSIDAVGDGQGRLAVRAGMHPESFGQPAWSIFFSCPSCLRGHSSITI